MKSLSRKTYWLLSEARRRLQKSAPELQSLHVEITNRCNLQCRHCYMNSVCTGRDELSTAEWLGFFSAVQRDFGSSLAVQISGGEALLRPDLFVILQHLKEAGFRTSLISNGLLLDRDTAERLAELTPSISVSLDGFRDSHDYLRGAAIFDRVVANIRQLKSAGFRLISIKTTVYRRNLWELSEFRHFVRELGADHWQIFAMEPIGRGRLNRAELLSLEQYLELCEFADRCRRDRQLGMKFVFGEGLPDFVCQKACDSCRYHRCGAGITFCGILHNGDIVSCIQDERTRQKIYGNILTDQLKAVWAAGFGENRATSYDYCDNHHYLNQLAKQL